MCDVEKFLQRGHAGGPPVRGTRFAQHFSSHVVEGHQGVELRRVDNGWVCSEATTTPLGGEVGVERVVSGNTCASK